MSPNLFRIQGIQPDWSKLKFPDFGFKRLSNGAQIYQIQSNKQGLCSFEIVFRNGRWTEHKKLSSRLAANQLQEGTSKLTAAKVADLIDFYGANLSIHADLDFTVISMSCLQKHFEFLLPFLVELLINPAYREADLVKAKLFLKSQLQHQLTEPDYVSYREFTSSIYGSESVYGYNTTDSRIDALNREDLMQYQQENYTSDLMYVFYCGDLDKKNEQLIENEILQFQKSKNLSVKNHIPEKYVQAFQHFPIENCSQISLKMGMRIFKKRHPDFYGMYVLNTILGDYFGSRLMKNIREDKGYTYDIHATLDAQVNDGCYYISAELNPKQKEDTILMIEEELLRLHTESVSDMELTLVKNYICGNILRMMDGPFQTIVFLKVLITEYGDPESFYNLTSEILNIDQNRIKSLAHTYLKPDQMSIITAGGGN